MRRRRLDLYSLRKNPPGHTHEKMLLTPKSEFNEFVKTMDLLGDKLGPLLFQFGYFNKKAFVGINDFLLGSGHSKKLPKNHKFAVRNPKQELARPQFVETLVSAGLLLH